MNRSTRLRKLLEAHKTLASNDKSRLEDEEETKPRTDEDQVEVKRRKLSDGEDNVENNTVESLGDVEVSRRHLNRKKENAIMFETNPIISNGNVFSWKFEKISESMTDVGMYSDKFTFRNIDWTISISTFTEEGVKWLSIGLKYNNDNKYEKNWICETDATYKLLDENGEKFEKKLIMFYDTRRISLGYRHFIEWSKFKGNSIVVEIDFNFKYYDFSKNIPNFTDIKFNVTGTEFYVNKGMLCANSTYFYNLFVNENSQETNIAIKDVRVKEFVYFIASIHPLFQRRPTSFKLINYDKLMQLATKYECATLHSNCEQFLISTNTLELVEKFKYAEKYNYQELMEFCLASLKSAQEIKQLRTSVEFQSFKESTKLSIMNRLLDFS